MNYQELEQLFYQGELDTLITEAHKYLENDPASSQSIPVLLLLATAYHDRVYYSGHEEVYTAVEQHVIPVLRRILEIEPNNVKALYEILSYPLTSQYNLWSIGQPKLHITQQNKDEFIDYAQRLMQDKDYPLFGYNFLLNIYEGLEDVEHQLYALDKAHTFNQSFFAKDRSARDYNSTIFFMKKIDLLYEYPGYDKKGLLALIEERLPFFSTKHESQYIQLADIAYEQNDLDLSVRILMQLLEANDSTHYVINEFGRWHQILLQEIEKGYSNPDAHYFLVIIERNYSQELQCDAQLYFHHALDLVQTMEDQYFPHHFLGSYYFDCQQYEMAIPHLLKALEIHALAPTYIRYALSCFALGQPIDMELPQLQSHPMEAYGCTTDLTDDIKQFQKQGYDITPLKHLQAQLFQQADNAFEAYFEQEQYFSIYECNAHQYAMNCNNTAIALKDIGYNELAAHIAQKGLTLENFWELHFILIEALISAQDYWGAQQALMDYFEQYEDLNVPPIKHMFFQSHLISIEHYLLGSVDTFEQTMELLEQFYTYSQQNPYLSEYDLQDVEAAKSILHEILYELLQQNTPQQNIEILTDLCTRFPKEAYGQYILMQIYNELENYPACALAAERYLENKPDFMLDDFDRVKTIYMLHKCALLQQNYPKASDIFDQYDHVMRELMTSEDIIHWRLHALEVKAKVEDFAQLFFLGELIQDTYATMEWDYDKDLEKTLLHLAQGYYAQQQLKQAHQLLDQVLSYQDADPLAHDLKKQWKKPGFLSNLGF